jgi:hypothetical protein
MDRIPKRKSEENLSEYDWTVRRDEENICHRQLLGEGGYGQVHQVSASFLAVGVDFADVQH